jgi:hypothetical protein
MQAWMRGSRLRSVWNTYGRGLAAGTCPWGGLAGRLLVVLTILLMLVMPITEHLSNFDRFLKGGTDCEFTLLAGLLFAALIVLAMHRDRTEAASVPYTMCYQRGAALLWQRHSSNLRTWLSGRSRVIDAQGWNSDASPNTCTLVPLRI